MAIHGPSKNNGHGLTIHRRLPEGWNEPGTEDLLDKTIAVLVEP